MIEAYRNKQGKIPADLTARDLLMPLFRRKGLFAVTFVALLLCTVAVAYSLSHQYNAKMEILVNRERMDPMVTSQATNQTPVAPPPVTETEINSEVELIKSPDILKEVVLANGLNKVEQGKLSAFLTPAHDGDWYTSKAVKNLINGLKIGVITKTDVIEVDYKASDPAIAYGVLNKLASLYLQKHLAVRRPQGSYDFFANQTEKYDRALKDSEMRLAAFGDAAGTAAPDVQRTFMAQELINSDSMLHQAEQAVAADEQRIRNEQAQLKNTPARSSTLETSTTPDVLLQQLGSSVLAAQVKRTQLAMKYDPNYPLVREADDELAQTQAAYAEAQKTKFLNQTTDRDSAYELLRLDLAKTQADLAAQQATVQALQQSRATINRQMVQLEHASLKHSDLLRDVKANEDNYLLYLAKREQEHTSDALDQKRIGNVAIAVPPQMPVLPVYGMPMVLLMGFALALFVSVATAYTGDYMNSSIRTPSEINEILGIPALASFPRRVA
jgi:succinoglycan biosynthesis transport protein ExoP